MRSQCDGQSGLDTVEARLHTRLEVRPQLVPERPASRCQPRRAIQRRAGLADVHQRRHGQGLSHRARVRAAATRAVALVEIRRVLAARNVYTRTRGHSAQSRRTRASGVIAEGVFVRGGVPQSRCPGTIGQRFDQRRHVFGVEGVSTATAVAGPQMKILKFDATVRRRKRAAVDRAVPGRHGWIRRARRKRGRQAITLAGADIERGDKAFKQCLLEGVFQAVVVEILRRGGRSPQHQQDDR